MFDLTQNELDTLLRVAKKVEIRNKADILYLAEHRGLTTGKEVINYIYACVSVGCVL